MKKKYFVNVHYDVLLTTDVIAKSKEEAIDLAIEKLTDASLNEGEVCEEEGYVADIEDIPNPLLDKFSEYKKSIYNTLAGLVKKYGDRGILDVFEFCTETGNELQGSTIDRICYYPNTENLFIIFNANTDDYTNIEECHLEDLIPFIAELQEWLEEKDNPEK